MNFADQYKLDWIQFVKTLNEAGICYDNKGNCIAWAGKKKITGEIEVAGCYLKISLKEIQNIEYRWFYSFWQINIPIKIVIFLWLTWRNKNLTLTNLQKKNHQGLGICYLCRQNSEGNEHLFLHFHKSVNIWKHFTSKLQIPFIQFNTIEECLKWWSNQSKSRRLLTLIVFSEIWKGQNQLIFGSNRGGGTSYMIP